MAVNPYFNHITALNERSLYNDLIVENIKNSGMDVYYILRDDISVDPILRESFQTHFKNYYVIEMYFSNFSGPEGIGNTMSKFGLQVLDEFKFMLSKTQFNKLCIPNRTRPQEGDLIYMGTGFDSFPNSYFEITFIEPDRIFYPFGDFLIYEIQTRLFTFNYEKFETNLPVIDQIQIENTNVGDIDFAINAAVKTKEDILLEFDEKNPFGDF